MQGFFDRGDTPTRPAFTTLSAQAWLQYYRSVTIKKLPVLNQVGIKYGFSSMNIAIASTAGQAFHLLSPLVGFIYLLLHITGVEMGKWQIQSAKWAIGIFVAFSLGIFTMGGVPL